MARGWSSTTPAAAADVFNFILFHAKFVFVIYNFTTWRWWHKDKDYTGLSSSWRWLECWWWGETRPGLIYNSRGLSRSKLTVTATNTPRQTARSFHHIGPAERGERWRLRLMESIWWQNSAWNSNDLNCLVGKILFRWRLGLTRLSSGLSFLHSRTRSREGGGREGGIFDGNYNYLSTNTAPTTLLSGLPQRSNYIVKIALSVNIWPNDRTADSLQDERINESDDILYEEAQCRDTMH